MSEELKPCPWCETNEYLHVSSVGSLTGDMPDRPYRVCCTHLDHDTVVGPTAYGKHAAIKAWNTRTPSPQWQDIATAPKDGTWFLGFWPDCYEDQNRFCPTSWLDDGDESRFIDDSDWRDWQQPTHWMPLPKPPCSPSTGGGS